MSYRLLDQDVHTVMAYAIVIGVGCGATFVIMHAVSLVDALTAYYLPLG